MKQNYLIILDIDDTLITHKIIPSYIQTNSDFILKDLDSIGIISGFKYMTAHVWKRPYLNEFMSFLVDNFYVAVWTAAKIEWLDYILKTVLVSYADKFIFTWSRNQLDQFSNKSLTRVWERFPMFNKKNTMIIDDLKYVTGDDIQEYYCHLTIRPFNSSKDVDLIRIITGLKILLQKRNKINTRVLIEAHEKVIKAKNEK